MVTRKTAIQWFRKVVSLKTAEKHIKIELKKYEPKIRWLLSENHTMKARVQNYIGTIAVDSPPKYSQVLKENLLISKLGLTQDQIDSCKVREKVSSGKKGGLRVYPVNALGDEVKEISFDIK